MLAEYALIPDIFDSSKYDSPELCDVYLQTIKQPLLEEAIVRDLCDGNWQKYFNQDKVVLHVRAKELIKKLRTQNRLRQFPSVGISSPHDDTEWCLEALASHQKEPLSGIIATNCTIQQLNQNETVLTSIQKLNNALWWRERSPSIRPHRNTCDYLKHLHRILNNVNHIMFIDPHLDPTRPGYREFSKLLLSIKQKIPPLIEIHRVSHTGTGKNREYPTEQDWKDKFNIGLGHYLAETGLSVKIFIWEIPNWDEIEFHDRYLITNLIGICLSNGFDISRNSIVKTTWTRLGRKDRDDIQREFDLAANRHRIKYSFRIGFNAKTMEICND